MVLVAPQPENLEYILSSEAITAEVKVVTEGFEQPDVARVLTAQGIAGTENCSITIKGTDINGRSLSDKVTLANGDVSYTQHAYKTIHSITIGVESAPSAGESVSFGIAEKFGIQRPISNNYDIKHAELKGQGPVGVNFISPENGTFGLDATFDGNTNALVFFDAAVI